MDFKTHPTSRRSVKWSYILCRYVLQSCFWSMYIEMAGTFSSGNLPVLPHCNLTYKPYSTTTTNVYTIAAYLGSCTKTPIPQQPTCVPDCVLITPLQHIWDFALKDLVPQHPVCMPDLALKLPFQQMHIWWLKSPQPEIRVIQVMYLEVAVDGLECYLHNFFYLIVHYIVVAADSALYSVLCSLSITSFSLWW